MRANVGEEIRHFAALLLRCAFVVALTPDPTALRYFPFLTTPLHFTMNTNRRSFLRGTAAASLAIPFASYARPIGANDDIRLGFIGVGGRGSGHVGDFGKIKGCRVVAIADADTAAVDRMKKKLEGNPVEYYQDYRKLLANPDVDAVIIATPNHTHTVLAIHSLQAGKHVFVEKPVCHNIWEGRKLVEWAAKFPNLILQHGMQRRSDNGWLQIREFVQSGAIGKPIVSRGFCYKKREDIGKLPAPKSAPASVDYNLWSGPREMLPVNRKQFHYDWHWQWPYGNGDIGNQGPHQLDMARLLIDDPMACPSSVLSIGGRFGYDDDATTANTQIVFYDFKPVPVIFEVRGLPDEGMNFRGRLPSYKGVQIGNVLECEGGYVSDGKAWDPAGKSIKSFKKDDGSDHQGNFLKHIRAGKVPVSHGALTGHLSAALAHLANTSYRLGKDVPIAAIREQMKSNALFSETLERMVEHLGKNKVDTASLKAIAGPLLQFDGKAEQFTGEFSAEANKLSKEEYRAEFSIA